MSDLQNLSESALLELARENNDKAFLELISRARPVCLTVARSILGNQADTEDRMQNAFLKAWRNIGKFREDSAFTTWCCRIVTNECLMLIRSRRRNKEFSLDDLATPDFLVASAIPDCCADPEELVATKEIENLLTDELRKVPKSFRVVLVLTEVHQLTAKQIAERLNISVPAVKSRLSRARRELRRRVEAHGGRMGLATLVSQRAWAGGTRP